MDLTARIDSLLTDAAPLTSVVFRFPRPQFESAYQIPRTELPAARALLFEYGDTLALALALALAAWLVVRRRSRRGALVLTFASLAWFGFWRKGCVCAVGSVQNVAMALADPAFALPVTVLAFFALPLLFALFFGRVFCAAVCPLGAVQELVALRPVRVPRWIDRILGLVPHVVLGLSVLYAMTGAAFLICRTDPFVAFFRLGGPPVMLAIGALLLALGVFVARPYCRYFCPYGVLLAWASRLSWRHAAITPDVCVRCRLCEDVCPVGAIHPPTPEKPEESRGASVRRIALILVLLPMLAVLGAVGGARLDSGLSLEHRTVRLAGQIAAQPANGANLTPEAEGFLQSGDTLPALLARAAALRAPFRRAGGWLGAYIGLVVGCTLLGLSIRRRHDDYRIDHAACVSCARCFSYCPRDRLAKRPEGEGAL